ncbi:thiol:disulfide interchange protein DsbC [Paraburkholderia fungorum]|jgi:thiol:disulfide interchange protein DsbC|uniref:DsbC family protein n=1 Tax=Paraburkholderia fungorum TaxID=134537 RepID=UPI000D07A325|nr:DsbC family protein [Paraburkholderia fungorum]PRZ44854.1 thiol:disulfide interchange protein DsbC [Paraburkholderia fungorum]
MRSISKIAAALLIAGYAAVAHAGFPEELVKRYPAAQGAKIQQAFPGFWSVVKGGDVFFVRDDMSIIVTGNVIDLRTGQNLTHALQLANRPKIDITQLDLKDAIKFGSGTRKLYVFSDPDCPYCRRLDPELSQLKDVTIYLFPFPLAQLHPNAPGIAEAVWCQKDRAAAWSEYQELAREAYAAPAAAAQIGDEEAEYKARGDRLLSSWHDYLHAHHQPDQPTCDNPIARNLAFGEKWGINGTPALIFEDGTLMPGLAPTARIAAQLDQSHANLTASK